MFWMTCQHLPATTILKSIVCYLVILGGLWILCKNGFEASGTSKNHTRMGCPFTHLLAAKAAEEAASRTKASCNLDYLRDAAVAFSIEREYCLKVSSTQQILGCAELWSNYTIPQGSWGTTRWPFGIAAVLLRLKSLPWLLFQAQPQCYC